MVMNKYKDNPLDHLEAWLYESLNSDATPQDVYNVLVNTINEHGKYHEEGLDKAKSLLSLVKGKGEEIKIKDVTNSPSDWKDFWEGKTPDDEFEEKLGKYGYEYTPLTNEDINDKINATSSYNDGWTQQHYQNKIPPRY